MVSGGPPIFSESEATFTAAVIERDKVKKGGVERDGRSASGKNIGTVVENGVVWGSWNDPNKVVFRRGGVNNGAMTGYIDGLRDVLRREGAM